jgi:hypothetical protein
MLTVWSEETCKFQSCIGLVGKSVPIGGQFWEWQRLDDQRLSLSAENLTTDFQTKVKEAQSWQAIHKRRLTALQEDVAFHDKTHQRVPDCLLPRRPQLASAEELHCTLKLHAHQQGELAKLQRVQPPNFPVVNTRVQTQFILHANTFLRESHPWDCY